MQEGVDNVRASNGDYAFSVSVVTAKIHTGTPPCNLMTIGTHAKEKKSSGLVVLKGDPLLQRINKAIYTLNSNGKADELIKKWYDGPCDKKEKMTSGAGHAAAVMFDTIVVAYLLSLTAFY